MFRANGLKREVSNEKARGVWRQVAFVYMSFCGREESTKRNGYFKNFPSHNGDISSEAG